MLNKYIAIFSSPLFQVMLLIMLAVVFAIYRRYITHNQHYSEEERHLEAQLKYYGWEMVLAEKQAHSGIFEVEKEAPDNTSFVYYKVEASDKGGDEKTFWAKVEYVSAKLTTIYWLPSLEA